MRQHADASGAELLADLHQITDDARRAEAGLTLALRAVEGGDLPFAARAYLEALSAQLQAGDGVGAERVLDALEGVARQGRRPETVGPWLGGLFLMARWPSVRQLLYPSTGAGDRAPVLFCAAQCLDALPTERDEGQQLLRWVLEHGEASLKAALALQLGALVEEGVADVAVLVTLARVRADAGAFEEAMTSLEKAEERASTLSEEATVILEVGRLIAEYSDQPEEAVQRYYQALVLYPELADDVEDALDDFIDRWGVPTGAIDELQQLCERLDRGDLLVKVLEDRLETLRREAGAPEAVASLLLRLAEHAEYAAHHPRQAFDLYCEGLEVGPEHPEPFADGMRRTAALGIEGATERMEPLLRAKGLWSHLTRIWLADVVTRQTPAEKAELYFKAGVIAEERLHDAPSALSHFEQALVWVPQGTRYLSAAARVARRAEDWPKVNSLLDQLIKLDGAKVEAALTLAAIRATHLNDPAGAGRALEALIEHDGALKAPGEWGALEIGDALSLAPLVRAIAEARGGAVGARLMMSLAWILLARPSGAQEARTALHAAVVLSPQPGGTFTEIAERLAEAGGDPALAPWLASAGALPLPEPVRLDALSRSAMLYAGPLDQKAFARYPLMALVAAGASDADTLKLLVDALALTEPAESAAQGLKWLLDGPLKTSEDGALRLKALLLYATQLADHLKVPEEATGILTEALIDSDTLGGVRVVMPKIRAWFEARDDWAGYMGVMERGAAAMESEAPMSALRMEMASVAERQLSNPAMAAQILDPLRTTSDLDVSQIRRELSRLYQQSGDVDRRRALLAQGLAEAKTPEAIGEAARGLLDAAVEEPRDVGLLIEGHKRLLQLEPESFEHLDALSALYKEVSYTRARADVLERRWRLAPTLEHLDTLRELCNLVGGEMQRWDRAILLLQELRQHAPGDLELITELARAYEEVGDVEALMALYLSATERLSGEARLEVLKSAAQVAQGVIEDNEQAATLWGRIEGEGLTLGEAGAERVREARVSLALLHREAGRWSKYVNVTARLCGDLDDEASIDRAREAARTLASAEADVELQERVWLWITEVQPGDVEALKALSASAAARGDHALEAQRLGALITAGGASDHAAIIRRRARALWSSGQSAEALEAWRAYRALEPVDRVAMVAVRQLAAGEGMYEVAARVLEEERIAETDPTHLAHLDRLWARMLEGPLEAPERALHAWSQVLESCEDDPEALRAVYALYCHQGRWREAEEALARLLALAPSDRVKVALRADAARRFSEHGSDPGTAFDHMAEAVTLASDAHLPVDGLLSTLQQLADAGRLWDRLLPVLRVLRQRAEGATQIEHLLLAEVRILDEHLGDKAGAMSVLALEFERHPRESELLEHLVRLATDLQSWELLADVWRRLAEQAEAPDARVAWLRNATEVLEIRLGDVRRAFWMLASALEQQSAVEVLWADLWRLARAGNLWAPLVERYGRWLRQQPRSTSRAKGAMELAEVVEQRLGDWSAALELFLLALGDAQQGEAAWSEVSRLAETHDGWSRVAGHLEEQLAGELADPDRLVLLLQLARLCDAHLGDHERALALIFDALEVSPGDSAAGEAFLRHGETHFITEPLAEQAEARADEAPDAERRLGWLRLALKLRGRPGTSDASARILEAIVALDPADDEATRYLADHLKQLGRYPQLANLLERRLPVVSGLPQVDTLRDLWVIYRDWLDAPDKADAAWSRLQALRPEGQRACEMLMSLYEEQKAWGSAAELLAHRADLLEGQPRFKLLRQRVRLLHEQVGNADRALSAAIALSGETPTDLDLIVEVAQWCIEADEGPSRLLTQLEEIIPEFEQQGRIEAHRLAGTIARDGVGDASRAIDAFTEVMRRDPEDMETARTLAELLESEGRYEALVALLVSTGPEGEPHARSGDEALVVWGLHIADVQSTRLGRPREAIVTLQDLLDQRPRHRGALERLVALTEATDDHEGLVKALGALAPQIEDLEQVRALLEGRARTMAEVGQAKLAVRIWQFLITRAPSHREAHEAVRAYGEAQQDWDLLAWLGQLAADTGLPEARGDRYYELGQLHEHKRNDVIAAEEAYRKAVQANGSHIDALRRLTDLVRRRGNPETLEALASWLLARLQSSGQGPFAEALAPLVSGLQLDRGRIAEQSGQRQLMLACYQDAHRWSPGDGEVALALADALYDEGDLTAAASLFARFSDLPEAPMGVDPARYKADGHLRRAMAFKDASLTERALRHAEAAIHHPSTRLSAMETLIALRERAAQWDEAVRLRERLAAVLDKPERQQVILLGAAEIVETHMGNIAAALDLYRRTLDVGLEDGNTLRRLLPRYTDAGRVEDALIIIERLLAQATDPNRRAELRCQQAGLSLKQEDGEQALTSYQKALKDSPLFLPAVRGLIRVLDVAPSRERLPLLESAWKAVSRIPGRGKIPVLELLGAAMRARGERAAAVELYEEIQAADRTHALAQEALSDLYREMRDAAPEPAGVRRLSRAIRHRLATMRVRPGQLQDLRDLVSLYHGAGRKGWATMPLQVLDFVGALDAEERDLLQQLRGPLDPDHPIEITQGDWVNLVCEPGMKSPVGEMLTRLHSLLGPAVSELFSAPEEASGSPAASIHPPLVDRVEKMCAAMSLPEREVRIAEGHPPTVTLSALHPPTLMVGDGLLGELDHPGRIFMLARSLELTRGAAVYAAFIPATESLAMLVAALNMALEGDLGDDFIDQVQPARLEFWDIFLTDRLTGEQRRALAPLARQVAALGPMGFQDWSGSVRRTANRMGWLMSGDLAATMQVLASESRTLDLEDTGGTDVLRRLLDRAPAITDVYWYVFGNPLHELLGLKR
ncbi:MAG: hypothetical protein ACE366_15715 [Bradymonadia bacterium]